MKGLRQFAGIVLVSLATVIVSPLALLALADMKWLRRDEWFKSIAQLLSLFPGRSGSYLRIAFYRMTLHACATKWSMQIFSKFTHPEASVGDGTYIGMHCIIGRARLGAGVLIADAVQILSGRHQHGSSASWIEQGESGTLSQISIGEKTWIGAGALVMADVGRHCVIGAGTVITKPVPDDCVVVGNPGKIIRQNAAEQPSEALASLHEPR